MPVAYARPFEAAAVRKNAALAPLRQPRVLSRYAVMLHCRPLPVARPSSTPAGTMNARVRGRRLLELSPAAARFIFTRPDDAAMRVCLR